MSIPCFCSHCGARIRAPEKAAGRKAKCPKCGATTVVPALQAKDSPKDTRSVLEVFPIKQDAPQVKHWSAPPPVRITKVSEDKAWPKEAKSVPEVLPCEEDDAHARRPEQEPPAVQHGEDSEAEPPQISRPPLAAAVYMVWGFVALMAFTVAAIFFVLAALPETDVGTEDEAIEAAKNYVCPIGMSVLGRPWNPAWRPADNCHAVLNGKDWTVWVPTRVVDWSRFKGDPGGFFTITVRKVRPGHGNRAWDEIGNMKYHGRRDSVEE